MRKLGTAIARLFRRHSAPSGAEAFTDVLVRPQGANGMGPVMTEYLAGNRGAHYEERRRQAAYWHSPQAHSGWFH